MSYFLHNHIFGFIQVPSNEQEWTQIADDFNGIWNYPNCIGALDGKHVVMKCPPKAGSIFYNYKGTHSIVLMAIADAHYRFIYIDVGTNGRVSDGGVFRKCSFDRALKANQLHIPPPRPLPGRDTAVPFTLVADDAFAAGPYLMKPYSAKNLTGMERIFNYRLSRARRVIENAFGILSARFRVLRQPIQLNDVKTRQITCACCALHNFLLMRNSKTYFSPTLVDRFDDRGNLIQGEWRQEILSNSFFDLQAQRTFSSDDVKNIKEEYTQYFVNEGELSYQYSKI